MNELMKNKYLGTAFGLLVGDALGTTFEFNDRDFCEKNPIDTIVGGGPFKLKAGEFTDDGSMFLCSLESLLAIGYSATDHMDTFVEWYNNGKWSPTGYCFDIGMQTRSALDDYVDNYTLPLPTLNAGNGSLMRIASIAMYYKDLDDVIKYTRFCSELTHNNQSCTSACLMFNILLHSFIHGTVVNLKDYADLISCKQIYNIIMNTTYLTKTKEQISSSGYVVNTFEAVLWSFYSTNTFKECLIKAVHLGDDADTVGAIVGALAGAYYGFDSIPSDWSDIIWNKDVIMKMVEGCV